jgi:hypothetical protein
LANVGDQLETAEDGELTESSMLILSPSTISAHPAVNIRNSAGYPNTKTGIPAGILEREEAGYNWERGPGGA